MSIQLEARIHGAEALADVLSGAERFLARVPHGPFVIEDSLPAGEIAVGPFPVAEHGGYKELFTIWERGYLRISLGRVAAVYLVVAYRASPHEMHPTYREPTDGTPSEEYGYRAIVDAGAYRSRASFCLAALLIYSIAACNRSLIVDDGNRLKQGTECDPASVAAMFQRHADAGSFEDFSDAFCDDIDFARGWPTARAQLAELERSSS